MNIANKITISRIVLTFIFMIFLSMDGLGPKIVSLIVFIAAALSDLIDGRIAQKRNMVTDFGKLMDPIADKILVLSAFIAFVQMQIIDSWMVLIIISREILVTSLRLFALNKGKVLSAGRSGKHKTFFQMVLIFLILGFILLREVRKNFYTWNPSWESSFKLGIDVTMWIVVILTLYSGISYLWENRKVITDI
jgi:CDP-diacylglycerol--glycerol-3-phosphate 3-phosphatidyltransferase